jgi:hypothetical protein
MKIQTRGFKNKILINYVRSATKFFVDQLIPPKLSEKLDLRVVLRKVSDADGKCLKEEKYKYFIELDKDLSFESLLLTLAHEIVHVKQYVTMELKMWNIQGKDVDVWRGRRFRNLDYEQQPWELEANDLEESLYQNFIFYSLLGGTSLLDHINTLGTMRVSSG